MAVRAKQTSRARGRKAPPPLSAIPSLTIPAGLTVLAYCLGWLPGIILNWLYLSEANKIHKETGVWPRGSRLLQILEFVFFWIPMIILVGVILAILIPLAA